jgi:hypothetical protein
MWAGFPRHSIRWSGLRITLQIDDFGLVPIDNQNCSALIEILEDRQKNMEIMNFKDKFVEPLFTVRKLFFKGPTSMWSIYSGGMWSDQPAYALIKGRMVIVHYLQKTVHCYCEVIRNNWLIV